MRRLFLFTFLTLAACGKKFSSTPPAPQPNLLLGRWLLYGRDYSGCPSCIPEPDPEYWTFLSNGTLYDSSTYSMDTLSYTIQGNTLTTNPPPSPSHIQSLTDSSMILVTRDPFTIVLYFKKL